jgi:hypothetical protein
MRAFGPFVIRLASAAAWTGITRRSGVQPSLTGLVDTAPFETGVFVPM